MSFYVFLKPAYVLQTIVLALSIFNLVAFLWLAATVWLNGDSKSGIARLGVVGLSLSALFFFIHALLISSPLTQSSGLVSPEFLWHLIWLPALGVPYIWFAIGLYYAAMINPGWRRRRPYFLAMSGVFGCIILVLLILNQSAFTYEGTLRLIAYNDTLNVLDAGRFSPMVFIPILFLCYVTFCAIGPWFTVGRISRLIRVSWAYIASIPERLREVRGHKEHHTEGPSLQQALLDAFWDDPTDVELLEEPYLSWHLARPGLLLAALLMAALTTTLGILVVQSITNWIQYGHRSAASIPPQHLPSGILLVDTFPINLRILDLTATFAVALVILLIGYSVVRHGILIERSLARRGFFNQWRGIVIVSTAVAIFIAILVSVTHSNLGGLLLITSLAAVTYALFNWSSYTDHDRYIALLGPFVRSTSLSHWLNTDLQKTEQDLGNLFFHLCHDVLAVRFAYLTVAAGTLKRNFSYRWPKETILGSKLVALDKKGTLDAEAPKRIQITLHGQRMVCWVLPIFDERGLVAALYLGPREDGGAFTDEDMDLAQACGQRILDTLGDHEAMHAVAGLLRRRTVDVKLLGAQQRRVLHDEILPQMHLALLRLETLRNTPAEKPDGLNKAESADTDREEGLNQVIGLISDAHRRLATMMRTTAPGAPHRLERDGLMHAIHTMLEQDFQNAFDDIDWQVSEETATAIDEATPPAIAELIFGAVQEALRNAARHGRGNDVHRRLRLTLSAAYRREDPSLEVAVADDGVGINTSGSTTSGTGSGLLTHSALLAIAGGSLNIKSSPGEGVTVKIVLSGESLR